MTNNKTTTTKIEKNKIESKTYNFDIHLEQHIKGKTSMTERYNRDTVAAGRMDTSTSANKAENSQQQHI